MCDKPLVSVLMTSYNREKYISSAIESVLNSTYQNFELIIVDDSSRDNTVEIVRRFEFKDERIKFFVNRKNLGQFKNRNYAASLAQGKYLKFVDSDDLIYPTGLQVLVEMMEQFPEAGFGLCSLVQDDRRIYPFQLSAIEAFEYHYRYRPIFHKAPLSSIFRRQFFHNMGGFEVESVSGDYAFWLRIAQYAPVVLMPDGIVWYREHSEGEMEKARNNPLISFEYLKIEEMYLKRNNLISRKLKQTVLSENRKMQYLFILNLVRRMRFRYVIPIIRTALAPAEQYFEEKKLLLPVKDV